MKAPEHLVHLCAQHGRNGDIESWMTLFDSEAVFASPEGDVKTGEELRQFVANFAAMKPEFKMNVTKVIVAGDIALVHNEWSIPAQGMSGYGLEVARRQADGTWRLLIDDPFTVPANK